MVQSSAGRTVRAGAKVSGTAAARLVLPWGAARRSSFCFFFNGTATTEIYTLSLHDALPIWFALVLSGTPLENRLDELYSVVQFIDDRRLGPAFRFYNHHRVVDEKGKVLGYKNLAE